MPVAGGHGRARRDPHAPGHAGAATSRAAGTARRASAARAAPRSTASRGLMCMTRMNTFTPGETDHGRADEDVPAHPGPRHRRLLQLREGQDDPAPSSRRPKEPDGTRRMYQEDVDRSPGVPQVHRVLPVPGRLPRHPRPRGEQAGVRRPALLHPARRRSRCTRSTRNDRTRADQAARPGSASATSPSAAPRSAPSTSTSPTTPSSRSRSASSPSTTTRSSGCGGSSAAA